MREGTPASEPVALRTFGTKVFGVVAVILTALLFSADARIRDAEVVDGNLPTHQSMQRAIKAFNADIPG